MICFCHHFTKKECIAMIEVLEDELLYAVDLVEDELLDDIDKDE